MTPRRGAHDSGAMNAGAMKTSSGRLAASHAPWERARRVMPGGVYGHQNGAAHGESHPRFLVRGEGSHVWDVDSNEYVDWMCA